MSTSLKPTETAPASRPEIGTADRMSLTFTLSALLVAALVFGVSFFSEPLQRPDQLPTLDVILVQKKNTETPEKADFLAQSSQQGGGNSEEKSRPQNLISGPANEQTGLAPVKMRQTTPKPTEQQHEALINNLNSRQQVLAEKQLKKKKRPNQPHHQAELENLDMARLENEISDRIKNYARKPKKKYISASTREDIYAQYLHRWAAQVKRMGNLNYPDEARRKHLTGELILSVGIRRDGTVADIRVIKPSGQRVLDAAARHIVEISAPFEPLPENTAEDILYITRTWQFLPGNRIKTR